MKKAACFIVSICVLFACSQKKQEELQPVKIETQSVPITSNPVGATVYADGTRIGLTPCQATLSKDRDHMITVIKDGYAQEVIMVHRTLDQFKTLSKTFSESIDKPIDLENLQENVKRAQKSYERQEKSGESYTLSPSMIYVILRPEATNTQKAEIK